MRNFLGKLFKFIKSLFNFEVEDDVRNNTIVVEEEDPHAFHIETEEIEPEIKVEDIPDVNIEELDLSLFEEDIEELESQGGQCCCCCHFCKKDPDDISGYCNCRNKDMLEDDGCVDFEWEGEE